MSARETIKRNIISFTNQRKNQVPEQTLEKMIEINRINKRGFWVSQRNGDYWRCTKAETESSQRLAWRNKNTNSEMPTSEMWKKPKETDVIKVNVQ